MRGTDSARARHPREGGGPFGQPRALVIALDSRLRGNDEGKPCSVMICAQIAGMREQQS